MLPFAIVVVLITAYLLAWALCRAADDGID